MFCRLGVRFTLGWPRVIVTVSEIPEVGTCCGVAARVNLSELITPPVAMNRSSEAKRIDLRVAPRHLKVLVHHHLNSSIEVGFATAMVNVPG